MDLDSIVAAAQNRLKELRKELSKLDFLRDEEQKLARLLEAHGHPGAAAVFRPRGRKAKGKGGRPAKRGGPSVLASAVEILEKHAGTAGMTVKDVLGHLRKLNPGHFNSENASGALSSALSQAMKAKTPRVRVLKRGGPGKAAKYGAAGSVPPGRKVKAKGSGAAKTGAPSKLGLATDVLKKFAGTKGMTVREILAQLRKSNADLFKHKDASALLSRAFGQSMKGKSPKVKVIKRGGPGIAAKYGAA